MTSPHAAPIDGVSILITSYNYASYLPRAIASARAQEAPNLEIVIVDNASTDASWDIIQASAAEDTRIRPFRNDTNVGPLGNHMRAAEHARHERLLYLAADDVFFPGHLTTLLGAHAAQPDIDYFFTSYVKIDDDDRFLAFFGHTGHLRAPYAGGRNEFADLLTYDCYACFPTTLCRRSDLLAHPFGDEILAADLDYYLRLASEGKRFGFINRAGMAIRLHENELSGHERYVTTGRQLTDHVLLLERHLVPSNNHLIAGREDGILRLLKAKIDNLVAYPARFNELAADLAPRIKVIEERLLASRARTHRGALSKPTVSVVLLCDDDVQACVAAAQALAAQDYERKEIIAVHRGHVDTSKLLAGALRHVSANIMVQGPAYSQAVSWNDALRLCNGEVVVYADRLTSWQPGHLRRLAGHFEKNDIDVVLVRGDALFTRGGLDAIRFDHFYGGAFAEDAAVGEGVPLATVAHRRSLVDEVGGIEEQLPMLAEFDFVARLVTGRKIGVDTELTVTLRKPLETPHPAIANPNAYLSALQQLFKARQIAGPIGERRALHLRRVQASLQAFVANKTNDAATAFLRTARGLVEPATRHEGDRPRILVIDDLVPYDELGRGYPRARKLLESLRDGGYDVLFYPLVTPKDTPPLDYGIPGIEPLYGRGPELLALTLAELLPTLDALWVSRPHNMKSVLESLASLGITERRWGFIYDAEAIYVERHAVQAELAGRPIPKTEYEAYLTEELRLTDACDAVSVVSAADRATFGQRFKGPIETISFSNAAAPTNAPFAQRDGALFVGAVEPGSPNEDSLLWYCEHVAPRVAATLGSPVRHAGVMASERVRAYSPERVTLLGLVPDLRPVYERARIFIAPTRFAAGLPQKVYEAAAHGVPVIVTPLLARQLGWKDGEELLVAETPDQWVAAIERLYTDAALWQRLRERALEAVRRSVAPDAFSASVLRVVSEALSARKASA